MRSLTEQYPAESTRDLLAWDHSRYLTTRAESVTVFATLGVG